MGCTGAFFILISTLIGLYKAQKIKDDLGEKDVSRGLVRLLWGRRTKV